MDAHRAVAEGSSAAKPSAQETPGPPPGSQVVILTPEVLQAAAERGTALQVVVASAHSGPLPAPGTLREYQLIVPGLPQTLIDEFRSESAHRRKTQSVGQYGAIGVALAAIVAGTILGINLQSAVAALAVIGPVCGAVGTAQLLEFWLKAR